MRGLIRNLSTTGGNTQREWVNIRQKKRAPYASTYEERPQKSKRTPDPSVSNLEVVMTVSHLMEQKKNITMTVGCKYLAWIWKRGGWYARLAVAGTSLS